jgi:hypothetical protein
VALRGKKPEERPQRIKCLLSGPAGVGKTTTTIKAFPRPYVIDTEKGSVHYGDIIEAAGGAVFESQDINEILNEVRELIVSDHPYLTVVIDPITTVYHLLGDEGEKKVGTEFHKHYKQYADKFIRRLMTLLTQVDMNVVVTAHSKNLWGKDKDGNPTIIGETYDGYGKLEYAFDLYLQLTRDRATGQRSVWVEKTRMAEFPDRSRFELTYDELVKRFGKERLERGAATVTMATKEQAERFTALLKRFSEEEVKKLGIDKAMKGYDDAADMPGEKITKAIEFMEKHLNQAAA